MKIEADRGVCIGAGMCALTLPSVFDQSDDDGTVILLTVRPGPAEEVLVRRAVQLCPSGALSVTDGPGA
ncbi:ferredoxin [Rhizohabitans arisaemae]|uniref:ferredoxin n=1 Tax=Rhizohabitans arisaemae TaxID=2720610 RepID=UPI0024B128BA|nr:(4Fe-4S)-binding protein [Rhizohabitans arisaemae]